MNDITHILSQLDILSPRDVPTEIALLILILGAIIFLWDLFDRQSSSMRTDSGLDKESQIISIRGSSYLPGKHYVSKQLGLSSKPDAIVIENSFIIPVDIKPLSNKVKDRHVIAMLTHLKLIEEIEGKRPPYGILIMGKNKRKVKIQNTKEKQIWLQSLIDEMQSIIDGVPAVPTPSLQKCRFCNVNKQCKHTAWK